MTWGWKIVAGGLALILCGCATMYDPDSEAARRSGDRALARWTSPTLATFESEEEFRAYLRDLRSAAAARGQWWARPRTNDDDVIIVTGSRIQPRNASITNVQERGVDEGDIVKQIDRFLIVLQDGRLFSVDTGTAPGAPLRLADRANVYRSVRPDYDDAVWYDEMLVQGDLILVTAYSYRLNASELSVFRMDPEGRLSREGIFLISSNDYYSSSNYATRLVDGNLLIYTPIDLTEVHPRRPLRWPLVRRWRQQDEQDDTEERRRPRGRPLFDVTNIHRPTFATIEPTVHTVSICPLGPNAGGRDLRCRSTAFIGSGYRQLYVTPTDAYLFSGPGSEDLEDAESEAGCASARPPLAETYPTHIYRIPVDGRAPQAIAFRGATFDQFSLQARDGEFRALLSWPSLRCDLNSDRGRETPIHFTYFSMPLTAFSREVREAPASSYVALPDIGAKFGETIVDRFTDDHVVYGRLGHGRQWGEDDLPQPTRVAAVPFARPQDAVVLTVPHNVIRAEQAGEAIVLTGYGDWQVGLSVSLLDFRRGPRLAATHRFTGRFETEGRSHAFNSLIGPDGSGLLGLPTVQRVEGDERRSWRSRASDLSFLIVGADGRLSALGELVRGIDYDEEDEDGVPGYECEVSCVDWYGNSRPIFTDGRIFALAGAELIEGRIEGGRIREVQRLNIALAPRPGS